MYRLIILAAITVALCGKAQSCGSVNIPPYNVSLQCVKLKQKSRESVSQFNDVSNELVNQLPNQNSLDYTTFEFVSSNVSDTFISLFLHFHRKTYII